MTEQEFNTLEVGDVVKWFDIICEVITVRAHGCDITPTEIVFITKDGSFSIEHLRKQNGYDSFEHKQEFSSVWMNADMTKIQIISKNSQKSLENKIKEKEIELETLKKELKEVNRKKMFENLDPTTIYKVVHEDFDVGFVREWLDDSYRVFDITMRLIITIPKDRIKELIPLKEATETYKKLKDLLEKA